jgi:putative transcriptional regulator
MRTEEAMVRKRNLGDMLIQSLTQAIAYEKGDLVLPTHTRELTLPEARIDTPPRYNNDEIRAIRLKLGYSQPVFAKMLNVSVQSVRAWEQGTRVPDGASWRLLELAEESSEALTAKVHYVAAD